MNRPKCIRVPDAETRVMALRSPGDQRVVAHGRALPKVLAKARTAGAKDPVVVFVPERGRRYIF